VRALGEVGDAQVIQFLERLRDGLGPEEMFDELRRHCTEAIAKIKERTGGK